MNYRYNLVITYLYFSLVIKSKYEKLSFDKVERID